MFLDESTKKEGRRKRKINHRLTKGFSTRTSLERQKSRLPSQKKTLFMMTVGLGGWVRAIVDLNIASMRQRIERSSGGGGGDSSRAKRQR
jgi:hypothetical protein